MQNVELLRRVQIRLNKSDANNTLARAVALRKQGKEINEDLLPHLSQLGWEHINRDWRLYLTAG